MTYESKKDDTDVTKVQEFASAETVKKWCEIKDEWSSTWDQVKKDLKFESGDQETTGVVKNFVRKYVKRLVAPTLVHAYRSSITLHDDVEEHWVDELTDTLKKEVDKIITNEHTREAAEVAYRSAVTTGWGALRVDIDARQRIKVKTLSDVTSVFPGPHAETDGSDMTECLIVQYITAAKAKALYDVKAEEIYESGSPFHRWGQKYGNLSKVPEIIYYELIEENDAKHVKVSKYVGDKKVEEAQLDITYIPVILTTGEIDYTADCPAAVGRSGLVKTLRGQQKILNALLTKENEVLAQSALDLWLGSENLPADVQKALRDSITKNLGFIPLPDATPGSDLPITPPQLVNKNINPLAFASTAASTEEGMESLSGLSAASFGIPESAGESGYASYLHLVQAELSTIDWQSQYQKSLKHLIRVVIDMLLVTSNASFSIEDDSAQDDTQQDMFSVHQTAEETRLKDVAMTSEDFEIGLVEGPIDTTRKQLQSQQILKVGELVGMDKLGDIVIESMELSSDVKKRLSDRIYKMLPPELQDRDEEEREEVMDPEAAAALQAAEEALAAKDETISALARYLEMLQDNLITQRQKRENDIAKEDIRYSERTANARARETANLLKVIVDAQHKGVEVPSDLISQIFNTFDIADERVAEIRSEQEVKEEQAAAESEQFKEEVAAMTATPEGPEMDQGMDQGMDLGTDLGTGEFSLGDVSMPPLTEGPVYPVDAPADMGVDDLEI